MFQSNTTRIVLSVIAGLLVLCIVFSFGMFVGFKKANFSYRWGENYSRNFGGPRYGMMNGPIGGMMGSDYIQAFGTTGKVIKIDGKNIIVKTTDNAEKAIVVSDTTSLISQRSKIQLTDVKVDDTIVAIGEPNENGQIVAKLVRVFHDDERLNEQNYSPRGMMNFSR